MVLPDTAALERPAKLQRLERFRRAVPHASVSALEGIIAEAKRDGLPELASRAHFREARDALMSTRTSHGYVTRTCDLVPSEAGTPAVQLRFVNLWAALELAVSRGVFYVVEQPSSSILHKFKPMKSTNNLLKSLGSRLGPIE